MSGYTYSQRVLDTWSETAQDHNYYEAMLNAEHNARYWKARALSAERRMLEHECTEES